MTRIPVGGERPYDVLVGRDLLAALPALLPGATRVAVLHAPPLRALAEALGERLAAAGVTPLPIEVPDAEAGKTHRGGRRLLGALGAAGFTRTDAVVGVGGGAVTDLAGFVAACWLRGVRWVPVPTSLLGMVDAAVGGKTGVNTGAGKNLVGAFHPPAGVLCDLATLDSLPAGRPGRRAGRGGQVRLHRRPGDPGPDRGGPGRRAPTRPAPVLRELIERAIRVKAEVVSGDLRSPGCGRSSTTGTRWRHAIEKVERLPLAARARGLGRPGLRRPSWPGSPAGSTPRPPRRHRGVLTGARPADQLPGGRLAASCWRRCGSTRRPGAAGCASWCSTGWPGRRILEGPDDALLRARLPR